MSIDNHSIAAKMSLANHGNASLHAMLLQIYNPKTCKQLKANISLLNTALQAAKAHIEVLADIELVLAVSRGLEVLGRVQELLDRQD